MATTAARPYLSWSTEEIERHLWALEKNEDELEAVLEELSHRTTQRAKDLARKIGRLRKDAKAGAAHDAVKAMPNETRQFMTKTLERLREKLIDISKRNPLIAFKHSERGATYIRVVDELPDALFEHLQSRAMSFEPLPNPEQEPADQKTATFQLALERAHITDEAYLDGLSRLGEGGKDEEAVQKLHQELVARVRESLGLPKLAAGKKLDIQAFARANGFNPSLMLPLPEAADAHHRDSAIRVLYTRDRFEARLRTIYDRYRGHAAELGIHTLQIAFGFVEWREAEGDKAAHHAPLLLMPVHLRREVKGGRYVYSLTGEDENPSVNMALLEMLRRNFGVVLPPVDVEEAPEAYFVRVQEVFDRAQRGLHVERFVTIAVLPFPNMAVWSDLDPACWPGQSIIAHAPLQTLLGARGGATGSSAFPKDYAVEDLPDAHVPPLVLEADVSQHSALIDVSARKSLALEGPPGTGKSQTIANMIAGALASGRRVLFVAEKRAALEVVGRRLHDLGFGPLMLELHSERATKGQLVESLGERIQFSATAKRGKLEDVRKDIAARRETLRSYRALLRRKVGALARPLNELIWREMTLRTAVEKAVSRDVWTTRVRGANKVDRLGIAQKRESLEAIEATASAIQDAFGSLDGSRWHGVRNAPAHPIGQDEVRQHLRDLRSGLQAVSGSAGDYRKLTNAPAPTTLEEVMTRATSASTIPDGSDYDTDTLGAALSDPGEFASLTAQLTEWRGQFERLRQVHPMPLAALPERVAHAEAAFSTAGLEGKSLQDARVALEAARTSLAQLESLTEFVASVVMSAAPGMEPTARILGSIAAGLAELDSLSDETHSHRCHGLLADDAASRLSLAAAAAADLVRREDGVSEFCDLSRALSAPIADVSSAASALGETSWLMRPFSSAYRAGQVQARGLGAKPKAKASELAAGLNEIVSFRTAADEFRSDQRYASLFPTTSWGGHRSGFEKAGDAARSLAKIDHQLRLAGAEHALPFFLEQPMRALRLAADRARAAASAIDTFASEGAGSESLEATTGRLRMRVSALEAAIAGGEATGLNADAAIGPGAELSSAVSRLVQLDKELREASGQRGWFAGVDDDPSRLQSHFELASELGDLPDDLIAALRMSDDPVGLIASLRACGMNALSKLQAFSERWSLFNEAHEVNEERFLGAALESENLDALLKAIEEALADEAGLKLFADLARYLRAADDQGVRWVYDKVQGLGDRVEKLADVYELALIRTLLQDLFRTDGELWERLGGAQLSDASRRFVDLDKLLAKLEAQRIIAERLGDLVPGGNGSGPRPTWTDRSLIENEVSKSRRHVPIRDLVTRAHSALQVLKPVWLMSPTSVAQFVPPGTAVFDLILIDEASQMTPEMAAGALARGAQIVVVGDPKQLPPTNFFKNRAEEIDEDEDDDGLDVDNESILDLAFSRLNDRRRLKWHYRSQHASLIQFSNRQFYDSELVVFPSPITSDDFLGVKSRFVGGAYEGRVNVKEAEAVIEALVGFIYARPELTYGVVAMNTLQRELIFQEFERLKTENKVVRDYAEAKEGTVDELFIKNLENVQGDERDVILISTLYGPPPGGGRVMQRFGLFNRKDGHRRLNVLVTRARMATLVFTSVRPSDIVVTETSSHGVRAFREYLSYADGAATADDSEGGVPDSDFEEFVAERVRACGYEVLPQVGVEGFRIDLGIKHPAFPSGFLAGVECDGASYHSSLSVRDRDRIRQDVLERLGWRIYRVWSTDWFNDPERETTKLVAWLDGLRERAEAALSHRKDATPPPRKSAPAQAPLPLPPPEPVAEARLTVAQSPDLTKDQATAPRHGPSGKRRVLNGIEFYEELPGFFEVWIDGEARGSIERLTTAVSTATVYGGSKFQAQKPQFLGTRYWDDGTFNSDDIYAAVRRLAAEYHSTLAPA